MNDETKRNLELRRKIIDLGLIIQGEIDHGECFYEEDMLADFYESLNQLKYLAMEYYNSNKTELQNDIDMVEDKP